MATEESEAMTVESTTGEELESGSSESDTGELDSTNETADKSEELEVSDRVLSPNDDDVSLESFSTIELAEDEQIEIIEFGDLQEGDVLIGSDGRTSVIQAYDHHVPESMYLLETDSGVELKASGNHLIYVVTANNRDLHRKRLAEGKRLGKSLSKDSIETLEQLATSTDGKHAIIAEFQDFLVPKSKGLRDELLRVAESLGPVSESNLYVDDLGGREEPLFSSSIQNYDRRLFAQQLLSVLNIGKSRKKWPPIVGTVMTVEMLVAYSPEDIYIPDPPEVVRRKS